MPVRPKFPGLFGRARNLPDTLHALLTGSGAFPSMLKDQDKGTISVGLVHQALQVAVERGVDVDAVLAKAGIGADLMKTPKARVTSAAYAQLWAALADVMDDEFFGMDSHPMRRGSYRLMCHAVLCGETLERALRRMLSFLRAVLDDLSGELRYEGERAMICVHDRCDAPRRMFTYATWLMLVHGLACWLVGRRLPLLEASFRCVEPSEVADYRTRFCETATFAAPLTQVSFDARLLDLKVVATEAGLRAFLRGAPANLLVKYRNDASLSATIRRRLRRQRPDAWPEVDDLARSLFLSGTTLQRRLQGEGTSYQRLKDDLRRDIAIGLLSTTSTPVADVAEQVGFQETSAFHRAFKKWTGVSPGAYRGGSAGTR
jgi:AraC-like DNA-binding protein